MTGALAGRIGDVVPLSPTSFHREGFEVVVHDVPARGQAQDGFTSAVCDDEAPLCGVTVAKGMKIVDVIPAAGAP